MTTRVIKAPLFAGLAVGDWLKLFVLAAQVHLLVFLATGRGDITPGLVLLRTVFPDVSLSVAVAAFYRP